MQTNSKLLILLSFLFGIATGFGILKSNLSLQFNKQNKNHIKKVVTISPTISTVDKTENTQKSHNITLVKKCTVSYDYNRHFQVKICLNLPPKWQQHALGYENHIVFKENLKDPQTPIISIRRYNTTNTTTFLSFVNNNIGAVKEYDGTVISKQQVDNNTYLVHVNLKIKNNIYRGAALYYNDTKNGFYWSVTFISSTQDYKTYEDKIDAILKSFSVQSVN